MLAASVQKGFPEGVLLPDELRALCEFADDTDCELGGLFEFNTDGRESANSWFASDTAVASLFAVFGRGPDDSLYAFWLHAGPNASDAPVVYLDSEGQENKVIAANARE